MCMEQISHRTLCPHGPNVQFLGESKHTIHSWNPCAASDTDIVEGWNGADEGSRVDRDIPILLSIILLYKNLINFIYIIKNNLWIISHIIYLLSIKRDK